ncbi:hypothetical protein D3C80_2021620 [compost metagenome]
MLVAVKDPTKREYIVDKNIIFLPKDNALDIKKNTFLSAIHVHSTVQTPTPGKPPVPQETKQMLKDYFQLDKTNAFACGFSWIFEERG